MTSYELYILATRWRHYNILVFTFLLSFPINVFVVSTTVKFISLKCKEMRNICKY